LANGTPVTTTVGDGGLTPSDPGAVEEWLEFNVPYDGPVSGRTVCPFCRGVASSEAEMTCPLEGRFATLKRGRDDPPPRGQTRYPRARRRCGMRSRGCGWAALCVWAVCWDSLSPFLSSKMEGGCRPLRARWLDMRFAFLGQS